MNEEKRPVAAQHSCAKFRHGFWSLDEEPAVCENCEFYDDGFCTPPADSEEKRTGGAI